MYENYLTIMYLTKLFEYKNWSDVVKSKKINSQYINLQVLPDEINDFIMSFLSIKKFICLRILNKEFNQYVLSNLPQKLENNDIIIDTDFARVYSKYVLSKNVSMVEYINPVMTTPLTKHQRTILIGREKLSEKFIRNHVEDFDLYDWELIWTSQKVSDEFILEFKYKTIKSVEEFAKFISLYQDLYGKTRDYFFGIGHTSLFLEIYKKYILNIEKFEKILIPQKNRYHIWSYRTNDKIIRKFKHLIKDKWDWQLISKNSKLSEEFIVEFFCELNWNKILKYQNLSTQIINKFKCAIKNWDLIWKFQKVPEDFIRENINYANWDLIWQHQCLTYDFVVEHLDVFKHLVIKLKNNLDEVKKLWTNANFTISDLSKLIELSKTL